MYVLYVRTCSTDDSSKSMEYSGILIWVELGDVYHQRSFWVTGQHGISQLIIKWASVALFYLWGGKRISTTRRYIHVHTHTNFTLKQTITRIIIRTRACMYVCTYLPGGEYDLTRGVIPSYMLEVERGLPPGGPGLVQVMCTSSPSF